MSTLTKSLGAQPLLFIDWQDDDDDNFWDGCYNSSCAKQNITCVRPMLTRGAKDADDDQ